ncbi:Uncharacterised protein [Mycobacteroides abscessus subsp. massiliense]|uniref:hypothetical protein n=1 Tax=Mycobacteroides abscessus TaxID=36809 RepID=UPI0009A635DC|nr:hypothetical protein [Mycobacteroides abscessus]SKE69364.1 Uncharacterised protein [Mycobacteroides abscessus subsp. massiliense]SKH81430.1 Uncharacterised protein [Mycobacteroides abscessus subsp. massiliense]SKI34667.1 Uncharacterised protein [Mycobacteroides abscessus subsp. massiliense]SKJ35581.1 Uncharacterised protein [Mycobacteroides abscessus subsp. massiliense]SKK24196.1 Uncharacterised protein [Mycobacteroides abscessus subsp. massiliense]
MPTSEQRDRRAADLRGRAALVRRDGWAPYENVWSSGEVAGVRAVLGEPGAVDAAVEQWAPTLWGVAAAEADCRTGYRSTRKWFAAVAQDDDNLEMTEAERARLAASNAAISELAGALLSRDREGADAAFAAVQQANTNLDREALLDKIHMPRDAEGFEDGLRRIMARIPNGWGRWISCSRGWYPIVIQLDHDLAAIDPHYELHQVKEKLGGLRYYFGVSEGVSESDHQRMRELVRAAEERCEVACELCGEPGVRHTTPHGWLKTLCAGCAVASEKGYEPLGELVNDLTPEHRGLWRVTCYGDGPDSHWDLTHGEVSIIDGDRHRDFEVLALPSVLRTWRIRLTDGSEIESGLIASIERVR